MITRMNISTTIIRIALVGVLGLLLSCASTTMSNDVSENISVAKALTQDETKHTAEYLKQSIGLILRDLGTKTTDGLVLMNGLENVTIAEFQITEQTTAQALSSLSELTGVSTHLTPYYTFVYDPTYETLVTLQIEQELPARYLETMVNISIGADTPLFSALALLGHSTGLTLVADNAIGDAQCGELSLPNVPLPQALEALLQSARIPQSSVGLRVHDDYLFFYSAGHAFATNLLKEPISAADRRALDESCSISLLVYTTPDNQISSQLGASRLHSVLPELSLQLGMPVRATEEILHLPVNPVVMNDISRATALELLMQQWLVPAFQYQVQDGTVLIFRR
ncbi:MAG: hypothetical protein VCD00_15405 [Candidatus Hydrogenedentota bacterium]